MIPGLLCIEKELRETISSELDRIGLLYRLFSRPKDISSIKEKIKRKAGKYQQQNGVLMQDVIGLRIVTYFPDDIDLVYSILKKKLSFVSESIDKHELTVFAPKRTNLIFRMSHSHTSFLNEVKETMDDSDYQLVDNTFEVQLRTILSEGWHEVDHSLRYKCKEDWKDYPEQERLLNGIYAVLETNDSTLKSLFNDLSYKHFKAKNWEGLIRTKYRLRFRLNSLKRDISELLDKKPEVAKALFKADRKKILDFFALSNISVPITFDNIVFIINHILLNDEDLKNLTPSIIENELKRNNTQ
ncbi:hypothetical protein ACT29H_14190 [Thermophagus sp. OGC60D27]|uniref:hypothetical protein n=1 Tax=Thermophagus sp. OGC60D27 TaxID=3458415 RepID=UPI0040384616